MLSKIFLGISVGFMIGSAVGLGAISIQVNEANNLCAKHYDVFRCHQIGIPDSAIVKIEVVK